ncbi:metallophosphoesterase [Sulfitobacter pacificus]|uniref:metallophosphoesterase n=1 Tax=Sulfitobacter pacificus TaxID=1499314 RepID=UPI003109ABD0
MKFLQRFSRRTPAAAAPFTAALAPSQPFYAIGDVHGCEALLTRLLEKIEAEITASGAPAPPIVFVGDYIDRGDHSAVVLRWLHALQQDPDLNIVCLMGNHEDMMIKFLRNPEKHGSRWLRYGGLQAISSFGVRGLTERSTGADLRDARDELRDTMGDDLNTWLTTLPTRWQSGNVAVVHAGADPDIAIDAQETRVLKWGHSSFRHKPRQDGTWVVHGHTIVEQANATDGRIAIDTGAYATGRLTAAHVSKDGVRFIST